MTRIRAEEIKVAHLLFCLGLWFDPRHPRYLWLLIFGLSVPASYKFPLAFRRDFGHE